MAKAGAMPARLPIALLAATLAAATVTAPPAAAQGQQAVRQQVPQQTPNDDIRLKSALGFEYRLDPRWRLRLDTQLVLDHDIGRARDLQFRPGVEYSVTPNWAVLAGYIQYQYYPAGLISNRGPFQDIAYGRNFGRLSLANRLRTEELFFDNNGALLIRTRYRLSAEHPIGDSPWAILVSDEVYFNLKTDGTNRIAGYSKNEFYGGLVFEVGHGAKVSAGYELTSYQPRGSLNEIHAIRLGFAFSLN